MTDFSGSVSYCSHHISNLINTTTRTSAVLEIKTVGSHFGSVWLSTLGNSRQWQHYHAIGNFLVTLLKRHIHKTYFVTCESIAVSAQILGRPRAI
jgi:hypothetical protein